MTDTVQELVQYLNLAEMREFCGRHGLPMYVHVEVDGKLRRSRDRDRKDVVLKRILAFALEGKRVGPTVYPSRVVSDRPLPRELTPRVRLKYGQYDKARRDFVALMQSLTDGAYRNGMISRLVLRDFWTAGEAPTLKQFAQAWVRATAEHTQPRPEGAYLCDLARGTAGPGWKRMRVEKAARALAMLAERV